MGGHARSGVSGEARGDWDQGHPGGRGQHRSSASPCQALRTSFAKPTSEAKSFRVMQLLQGRWGCGVGRKRGRSQALRRRSKNS